MLKLDVGGMSATIFVRACLAQKILMKSELHLFPCFRVAAVAIVIPLLLDTIFDLASSTTSPSSKDNKKLNSNDSNMARFNFMNVYERVRVF